MTDTIPDALAADLRELFLADQPLEENLAAAGVVLKHATKEPPSPRLVILPGTPQRISGQDATARVPFELQYITSMDRVTPEVHKAAAGKIDTWLREIRISHRRALIGSRTWMHDLYCMHPVFSTKAEDKEQVSQIRGEALVTLAITTPE